jgi:hypothetical protein
MGLAIVSSQLWLNGEPLVVYARRTGELVRFEDSGASLFDLETSGVDTASSGRASIIETLGEEYGVVLNEDATFTSEWMPSEQAGRGAIRFLSFMARLQDLTFTTRDRVARNFREDLLEAIEAQFGGVAEIIAGGAPVAELSYYTVDIAVRIRDQIAAIFPAITEQKALEAILFSKELELRGVRGVTPFLVLAESSRLSKQTLTKAHNSQLSLADWEGGAPEVLGKIAKTFQVAA